MKKETMDVGTKIGTERFDVTVEIQLPENVSELVDAAKGSPEFVVKMFNRGYRIWLQEGSGAREYVKGLSAEQRKDKATVTEAVQAIVTNADPSKPVVRAARTPREVTVDQNTLQKVMSGGDISALQELLRAAGLSVTIK